MNKPGPAPPAPSSAAAASPAPVWVDHPLLRREALEDRAYQRNIAATAAKRSTLVILPTGLGKTAIAIRVIADVLRSHGGKILFLAPTKPLVLQHATSIRAALIAEPVAVMTGENAPEDREAEWRESKIVVATPQVIENDLREGRHSLEEVSLTVFDEAHRAVGDYAYVAVGAHYEGLVLAMTASPGSSADKIVEVCRNLRIPLGHWEIRSPLDPDVAEYVHAISFEKVLVEVPEDARPVIARLRALYNLVLDEMKRKQWLSAPRPTLRDLLALGDEARRRLDAGDQDRVLYQVLSKQAIAVKLSHAVELAETQGLAALRAYLDRLEKDTRTRANRSLLKDRTFQEVLALVRIPQADHPKVRATAAVVGQELRQKPEARVIVFAHYRDTVDFLVGRLGGVEGVRAARFVGQAAREEGAGLTQREQAELLDQFRAGQVNVLVSTSIGEEGLDIPEVDLVVFYEPVPSEIRTIQRRGRTGRARAGRMVLLVTRDTRDEAYMYSARRKERKMHEELTRLREALNQMRLDPRPTAPPDPREQPSTPPAKGGQASLGDFR